jgi:hypothetical protein
VTRERTLAILASRAGQPFRAGLREAAKEAEPAEPAPSTTHMNGPLKIRGVDGWKYIPPGQTVK